jgi:hypothetical protein
MALATFIGATHSWADVDRLNAIAELLLLLVGDRVGNNDLLQFASVKGVNSVSAKNAVRNNGDDVLCAVLNDNVRGLRQRSASVGHVIDNYGSPVTDVSDEDHLRDFVRTCTFLVYQGKREVKAICYRCCPK